MNRIGTRSARRSRLAWRKSTYSGDQGDCVEFGILADKVAVRDSKRADGPRLAFCADTWGAFVAGVKGGR